MIEEHDINDYELGFRLGQGRNGNVVMARHKINKNIVAIKFINRDNFNINEIEIQSNLNHINIIKLFAKIDYANNYTLGLILEYASCRTLHNKLITCRKIDEIYVKIYTKQIIAAILYLHNSFIVHRDIKPENILLNENDIIKLCDFGLAIRITKDTKLYEKIGTLEFIAPEMLTLPITPYDYCVDIWSLGISIYELLEGGTPFDHEDGEKIIFGICNSPLPVMKYGGNIANDFILTLLQKDPLKRPKIHELFNQSWLIE